MSRRCDLTGKGPSYGNQRSFSNRATRRRFNVNLIKKRVLDPMTGKFVKLVIAASTLRTLLKQGRVATKKAQTMLQ